MNILLPLLTILAPTLPQDNVIIEHPCPVNNSGFGESVVALDINGDGTQEIAVGANGEDAVYVFFGDINSPNPYSSWIKLSDLGFQSCVPFITGAKFGVDIAAGEFDRDVAEELVVGAPETVGGGAVYVFGVGSSSDVPIKLASSQPPEVGHLGNSVITGDFNNDGFTDVAAGARLGNVGGVKAGKVHIFFGPLRGVIQELIIDNPDPVLWGNFGMHLSVGDPNEDGIDDLFVAAIGNDGTGVPVAGKVYYFPGPVNPAVHTDIVDPFPSALDLPGPRYGMHIDAREDILAVCAPRKDWNGIHDAGVGFTYKNPEFTNVTTHEHPTPEISDLMGFRCNITNLIGDSSLDVVFAAYPANNSYEFFIFDGQNLGAPPITFPAIPGSSDHFANGLQSAQLIAGGREELITGDRNFDSPGVIDSGRLVIYYNF